MSKTVILFFIAILYYSPLASQVLVDSFDIEYKLYDKSYDIGKQIRIEIKNLPSEQKCYIFFYCPEMEKKDFFKLNEFPLSPANNFLGLWKSSNYDAPIFLPPKEYKKASLLFNVENYHLVKVDYTYDLIEEGARFEVVLQPVDTFTCTFLLKENRNDQNKSVNLELESVTPLKEKFFMENAYQLAPWLILFVLFPD